MSDRVIFEAVLTAQQDGVPVLLATIVRAQGSVPRHTGTKMLIYPDGTFKGTIGGGEVESRILAEATKLLQSGETTILHYELNDPEKGDPGVCGGQLDIFMEPIMPEPTLLVIGCGHVGQAVADLGHWLGFRVIATDDRADLCNTDMVPHADEYVVCEPGEIAEKINLHANTYIVSVTRGVPFDVASLPRLLESPVPYIGVMGSRRRWATAVKELKEQGITDEALKRVSSPVGLDLHAETPREIAVSILGEIIARRMGGSVV